MKKVIFCFFLIFLSGASYANCAWGNCTPAQLQQEYQQNQLNQLNSINNSLQQIQRQQQQVPALGQWSNTPSASPPRAMAKQPNSAINPQPMGSATNDPTSNTLLLGCFRQDDLQVKMGLKESLNILNKLLFNL
jgi:hypothetical protein